MAKKKSADEILDTVQAIRTGNNALWMDILRIAYEAEPELVREIISCIGDNDKDITSWLKKL